jgi:hypothetical protein
MNAVNCLSVPTTPALNGMFVVVVWELGSVEVVVPAPAAVAPVPVAAVVPVPVAAAAPVLPEPDCDEEAPEEPPEEPDEPDELVPLPPEFGGSGPSTPDRSADIRLTTARLRPFLPTWSRPESICNRVTSRVTYSAASRMMAISVASRTSSSV